MLLSRSAGSRENTKSGRVLFQDMKVRGLNDPLLVVQAIRRANLPARLFAEERRRVKIIPHAFGERPVLKLMSAASIRASENWWRISMSQFERRRLESIRREPVIESAKKDLTLFHEVTERKRI